MPDAPFVSVVVPVRDGAATIRTCVEALLAQTMPRTAYEVLIVDNRSQDATRDIVAEYPVTLLEERTLQSSYAARNRGAAAARGPVLAFTDADCVPEPQWLGALAAAFDDPGVGMAAGDITAWRTAGLVERYQAARALCAARAFRHPVLPFAQTANAACRRTLFDAIGGFDATCPFGGDLDFSWRLQRTTGQRLAFVADARIRHRHRTTWHGLFALYEKNALANCLLSSRWPHYAAYPSWRTGAYLARETLRSGWRTLRHGPAGPDDARAPLPEAVRWAGELWGWTRWHLGARPVVRRRDGLGSGASA